MGREPPGTGQGGYASKIILASEVAFKCCYKKYGGYGYAHLLENIVTELRFKGVTEEQLNTMLVENLKRLLAYRRFSIASLDST